MISLVEKASSIVLCRVPVVSQISIANLVNEQSLRSVLFRTIWPYITLIWSVSFLTTRQDSYPVYTALRSIMRSWSKPRGGRIWQIVFYNVPWKHLGPSYLRKMLD